MEERYFQYLKTPRIKSHAWAIVVYIIITTSILYYRYRDGIYFTFDNEYLISICSSLFLFVSILVLFCTKINFYLAPIIFIIGTIPITSSLFLMIKLDDNIRKIYIIAIFFTSMNIFFKRYIKNIDASFNLIYLGIYLIKDHLIFITTIMSFAFAFLIHLITFIIKDINQIFKANILIFIISLFHFLWSYQIIIAIFQYFVSLLIFNYLLAISQGQNFSIEKESLRNLFFNLGNVFIEALISKSNLMFDNLGNFSLFRIYRVFTCFILGLIIGNLELMTCREYKWNIGCMAMYNLCFNEASNINDLLLTSMSTIRLFTFRMPGIYLSSMRIMILNIIIEIFPIINYILGYQFFGPLFSDNKTAHTLSLLFYSSIFISVSITLHLLDAMWKALILVYYEEENNKIINNNIILSVELPRIRIENNGFCDFFSGFYGRFLFDTDFPPD
ncbi:hypothetical protein TCON_0950 [Astathelohania contejeani]|uniref:Uncharacterized protein n=1 Tax=Astathelohania contejeani TaxID=164912 RepID=A0ABQ7I052_9MICR|nr:hypothetical protein TCON_0950 [Thelohania contejeani]